MHSLKHIGATAESTETSLTCRWQDGLKADNEETVNSDDLRKPKYASVQAAQNMQWSTVFKFKDLLITKPT